MSVTAAVGKVQSGQPQMRSVVELSAMKRLLPVLLLWGAACSSGPDEETKTLDFFNRLAMDRERFNGALGEADEGRLRELDYEIHRLVRSRFDVLRAGLESGDPERSALAAFGLGFLRRTEAIDPLVAATRSEIPEVKQGALVGLGILGFPEVPNEPFLRLLGEEDPGSRVAALFALRRLLRPDADRGLLPEVVKHLGDPAWQIRVESLLVLERIGSAETVTAILDGPVKDGHPDVRAQAAFALGAAGKEAQNAVPYLIEMLQDPDTMVARSAHRALVAVTGVNEPDPSYGRWRDWYEDQQNQYYSCPDHPEVEREEKGPCPVCTLPLEQFQRGTRRRARPPSGSYACPNHPAVVTRNPGTCGVEGCGRILELKAPEARTYVCPDHPGVLTTAPATCGQPGCGKALVPKVRTAARYACPDHPAVVTTTPSSCGKKGCGKKLVPLPEK